MMTNPYSPSIILTPSDHWIWNRVENGFRLIWHVVVFFLIAYAVSLPESNLLEKDVWLIVTSPLLPLGLLAVALVGQTAGAAFIMLAALPCVVGLTSYVFGVRTKRALIAVIALGLLYGLFLRLFYTVVNIA